MLNTDYRLNTLLTYFIACLPLAIALSIQIGRSLMFVNDRVLLGWHSINLVYAIVFFIAYGKVAKSNQNTKAICYGLLLFAHVESLLGILRVLEITNFVGESTRFFVSLLWGIFGICVLLVANKYRDKILAHSALVVFAISAGKVFLFDLSDATPITRVLCVLTLGAALFVGGYLTRKINNWS